MRLLSALLVAVALPALAVKPTVTFGEVRVSGKGNAFDAKRTANLRRSAVIRCAQEFPPESERSFEIHLTVGPKWKAENVTLVGAEEIPEPLRACLLRSVRGWKFPGPAAGASLEMPVRVSPAQG